MKEALDNGLCTGISPVILMFDPEKILYWAIFALLEAQGPLFQILRSPHRSALG